MKTDNKPSIHNPRRPWRHLVKSMLALLLAATLGQTTSTAQAADPDTLPGMGPQPVEYFYTGKPYDADTESYTFLYRNYDPEINRWSLADLSGFPEGANNYLYAKNGASYLFDPKGLTSKSISHSFSISVFGIHITNGNWNGAFVYSLAQGAESANITPGVANSGFSGFTGIPLTITIMGNTLGFGFRSDAIYYNRSSFETKMVSGVQWKRYVVDLEVKYKKILTIGADITSAWMGNDTLKTKGAWYE